MRRFGLSVLLVLGLTALANADVLTGTTYDAVYSDVGLFDTISKGTAYCTLTTSNTKEIWSGTVKKDGNRRGLDPGWEYVLVHDTITGTSAATGVIEIVIQTLDDKGYALQNIIVDSITGAVEQYGGAHVLPFFSEAIGSRYKVKLQGDTGAENIFNRAYIYRRRPVTVTEERD